MERFPSCECAPVSSNIVKQLDASTGGIDAASLKPSVFNKEGFYNLSLRSWPRLGSSLERFIVRLCLEDDSVMSPKASFFHFQTVQLLDGYNFMTCTWSPRKVTFV